MIGVLRLDNLPRAVRQLKNISRSYGVDLQPSFHIGEFLIKVAGCLAWYININARPSTYGSYLAQSTDASDVVEMPVRDENTVNLDNALTSQLLFEVGAGIY
jgi:hypothetical protein